MDRLADGAKITVGGVEFTAFNGTADVTAKDFDISSGTASTILGSLEDAIEDSASGFATKFNVGVISDVLTLTEATSSGTDFSDKNISQTLGEYSFEVSNMFVAGEQITIDDGLTFVKSGVVLEAGQFNIGSTLSDQLPSIKATIQLNDVFSVRFNINVVDTKVTLKEIPC